MLQIMQRSAVFPLKFFSPRWLIRSPAIRARSVVWSEANRLGCDKTARYKQIVIIRTDWTTPNKHISLLLSLPTGEQKSPCEQQLKGCQVKNKNQLMIDPMYSPVSSCIPPVSGMFSWLPGCTILIKLRMLTPSCGQIMELLALSLEITDTSQPCCKH